MAEELLVDKFKWRIIWRIRKRSNNYDWLPTGVLSGGGWAVHSQASKLARRYMRMYKVEKT